MSLQQKILKLRIDALVAARHASFWQKCITEHGEEKATAFYTHLGLNHLEKKSFEWEGLKLSREPKEHEKLCIKGIANAQESAKESIGKILLDLREELIADGVKGIKKLKPATYHELTLQASKESRTDLGERLVKVHKQGRLLVAAELAGSKSMPALWGEEVGSAEIHGRGKAGNAFKEAVPDDEFDELDMLTDLTGARVANDVQSRIIDAVARHSLLGKTGKDLIEAVQNEITGGSVSYIDRASRGLANKVINIGRSDEAESRSGEWDRVEYSALLDQNVCEPCAAEDGQTASNEDDLQPAPNPDCLGGDWCRCFHVFVIS
jgi:hypothetical protein